MKEEIILMPKNAEFCCKICDFTCYKKSNFLIHTNTKKHIYRVNGNQMENMEIKKNADFICKCGKKFITNSGLWKHNKNCNFTESQNIELKEESEINNNPTDKKNELIDYLIKENKEFKNLILEIVKKDTTQNNIVNNNITHTNSHNKSFNLNFFLNETCKNAMNINEFVDSIKLQLSDLESVGKIGYVEGLSKIIIKNLNSLNVTERPVHCSDSKRDTMYVKDEDKWEKENENNHKVLKAIEDIANKNSKMVKEWKQKNPECASSKSHKADIYSHIMIEAVCSNNDTNNNKILKKIAKEVTIDKN